MDKNPLRLPKMMTKGHLNVRSAA